MKSCPMHNIRLRNRVCLTIMLLVLGCVVYPPAVQADDIAALLAAEGNAANLCGRVMLYEPERGRLVIQEQEIRLVDHVVGSRTYRTHIMNRDGQILGREVLVRGAYLLVKGQAVYDQSACTEMLLAREIYLLPGRVAPEDQETDVRFTNPPEPW